MTEQYHPGGYIPGPAHVQLPPEPEPLQRLRHTLTRWDERDGSSVPRLEAEAVIEAARDVLHTVDTERQRMLSAMRTQMISAETMAQFNNTLADDKPGQ